jgi:hypothetical protein
MSFEMHVSKGSMSIKAREGKQRTFRELLGSH